MKSQPDARTGSVNDDLADYLDTRKEEIISEWRESVRTDGAIPQGKSINTVALTNRLPFIFDDLVETLRRYRSSHIADLSAGDAREHGAARWRQGYELSDVMREIKNFRSLLIFHMRAFEGLYPDNGMAAMLFVSTIVHRFLDEMVIDTAEEFLSSQLSLKDEMLRRREQREAGESSSGR